MPFRRQSAPARARRRIARAIESLEPRRLLVAIGSDQTLTGSISSAAEVDEYTFEASAGESIIAFVAENSTVPFDPAIQLIGPNAALITSDLSEVGSDIFVNPLPQTGTYTLRISDSGANDTGDYTVTLAKLGGPQTANADGGALASGPRTTGTISTGDLDVFTFGALGGDGIFLSLAENVPNTGFDLNLLVYGPNGALISQDFGDVATDLNFAAPLDGTYYVVVKDLSVENIGGGLDGDIETGSYALTLAHLPGPQSDDPGEGGPISSGPRVTGNLPVGDLDVYTLAGSGGDTLIISAAETGANTGFETHLFIYGPSGELVTNDLGDVGADLNLTLTADGTYYILIKDSIIDNIGGGLDGDAEAGTYALTIAHLPAVQTDDSTDGGAFSSGPRHSGALAVGDLDVFTFSAIAGENFILSVVDTSESADFEPHFFVYGPAGQLVGEDYGEVGADIFAVAPVSGNYYIVVKDLLTDNIGGGVDGGMAPGLYTLTMAHLPAAQADEAGEGGSLTSGPRRTGTIELGDMDVYTIAATAGSHAILSLADTGPSLFDPDLWIYGPNGEFIIDDLGNLAADTEFTAAATGTYYVVVKDSFVNDIGGGFDSDVDAGAYALTLALLPAVQTDDNGDGGPISSGARRFGTIALADLDVFTFSATAGNQVILSLAEAGPNTTFDPSMYVYGPTGTLIDSASTDQGSDSFFTAPVTGTYYVVVKDVYGNGAGGVDFDEDTGEYALSLAVLPAVQTDDAGDGGPLTSGVRRTGSIVQGDIDVWTLNVDAGDSIVGVARGLESGVIDLHVVLYSPSGALITQGNASTIFAITADHVASSGTYYVVIKDHLADLVPESGHYALTFAVTPDTQITDADSGVLVSGVPRAGAISIGDLDVYTFPVTAGQPFTLNLAETTAAAGFDPAFRLYDQTGTLLAAPAAAASVTFTQANPPINTTYTVVVFDSPGDESGAYSIALNSAVGPDNFGPRLLEASYLYNDPLPAVRIALTEDVSASFQAGHVEVVNMDTAATIPAGQLAVTYAPTGDLITIKFPGLPGGIPPDGNYRVNIAQISLNDPIGNPLDQAIAFDFFVMAADTNRDRRVDIYDLRAMAQSYGHIGRNFSQGNFDYTGVVDVADLTILAARWQKTVDPLPAAPMAATRPPTRKPVRAVEVIT